MHFILNLEAQSSRSKLYRAIQGTVAMIYEDNTLGTRPEPTKYTIMSMMR